MHLISLLIIAAFVVSSQAKININCYYHQVGADYVCDLLVYNPQYLNPCYNWPYDDCDELTYIYGTHVSGKSDADVTSVIGSGITWVFPKAICRQFPNLQHLEMVEMGIEMVNPESFHDCENIVNMNVSFNNLQNYYGWNLDYLFLNNKLLQYLSLRGCSMYNVGIAAFHNLTNLKTLDLSQNQISGIYIYQFNVLPNLEILDLSHNFYLSYIEPFSFQSNTKLKHLDFSYGYCHYYANCEAHIYPDTFSTLVDLEFLSMEAFGIRNLNEEIFINNQKLKTLRLGHNNYLNYLPPNLFRNQRSLIELSMVQLGSLFSLELELLKPLISLSSLDMSFTPIYEIRPQHFSSNIELRVLNLEGCTIRFIYDFSLSSVNKLTVLNLDQNPELRTLSSRAFGSLSELTSLRASWNNIDYIDSYFLEQTRNLNQVWFEGNNCVNARIDGFETNRQTNMALFNPCFDNFDGQEIWLDTYAAPYDWHSMRWNYLNLGIQATQDAKIALSDTRNSSTPQIEVFIGVDGNRMNEIRENGVVVETYAGSLLNNNELKIFDIIWEDEMLMVFKGTDRYPFMTHVIQNPFDINFFGVRTENSNGIWRLQRVNTQQRNEFLRERLGLEDLKDLKTALDNK